MAALVLTRLAAAAALVCPSALRAQSDRDLAADTLAIRQAVMREGPTPDRAWGKPIVLDGNVARASVSPAPGMVDTYRLERTADDWAIVALEERCSMHNGRVACGPPASCTAIPLVAWLILLVPALVVADLLYCGYTVARSVMSVWH
jgi:hypothetical protein